MSKSYDDGYVNAAGETWSCSTDAAAETHSDYGLTESKSIFGSDSDLIKSDLTVEQLNSVEFGVAFNVTAGADGAVVQVDSIKVKVYYRKPISPIAKEARRPTSLSSVTVINDRFVVVGAGGRCLTSDDDGATWVERTTGVFGDLWQVRTISNVLYAVGDNGTLITSTDGVTWTQRATGTELPLRSITATTTNIVVSGRSGIGLTSSDKESWRQV